MAGAGDRDSIVSTVTDLAYLTVRIAGSGPHAAETDLRTASKIAPQDTRIGWLRRWIAQNGHLFTGFDAPSDLAPTLASRLTNPPHSIDRGRLRPLLAQLHLALRWGTTEPPAALLRVLTGHTDWLTAVAFSPDGKLLASVSANNDGGGGTVRLWDLESGEEQTKFTCRTGWPNAVAFSTDGKLLATGDGTVRLWDAESGEEQTQFTCHTGRLYAVAFSPDGKLLASAGMDGTVRLWDIESRTPLTRLRLDPAVSALDWSVTGIAVAPGGNLALLYLTRKVT
jgi:WD40 repeat protein